MDDPSKIGQLSDDELLGMVRINLPGNISREAAKTELEFRHTKRLIESSKQLGEFAESTEKSTKRIAAFAESTEKSGRRMEFATWVILFATIVQLVLVIREQHRSVASQGGDTRQAIARTAATDKAWEVKSDTKAWSKAEVSATCSNKKEHVLSWFSLEGKVKQATLDCTLKNLTDKAVSLTSPPKMDALFRLPDDRVVRGNAYLGSNQHEIPARGEINVGLFPGNDDCPAKQSDDDCVRDELMGANELLLTDIVSGIRYHVRIE
jgi:hypothetical protein